MSQFPVYRVQQQNISSLQQILGAPPVNNGGGNGAAAAGASDKKRPNTNRLMRLRCKFKPLLETYHISDRDCDVEFICENGRVRAHKVILTSASAFFNKLFEDQTSGTMTSIILADETNIGTIRNLIGLCYSHSINIGSTREMKELAAMLPQFGFNAKSFSFGDRSLSSLASDGSRPQFQQQQQQQLQRLANRPGQRQAQIERRQQQQQAQAQALQYQQEVEAESDSHSGSASDYSSRFQSQQQQQQHQHHQAPPRKQMRLLPGNSGTGTGGQIQMIKILPKPNSGTGQQIASKAVNPLSNFRKILPKPMTLTAMPMEPAVSMTIGTNELQYDDEQGNDSSSWMDQQGNEVLDDDSAVGSSSGGRRNQCLICNNVFENEERWIWHSQHHVGLGIFKCQYCDELFSTSRKVYQHEMMEHGFSGTTAPVDDTPGIPSDFQIVEGRKRKFPGQIIIQNQHNYGAIGRANMMNRGHTGSTGLHHSLLSVSMKKHHIPAGQIVKKKILMKYNKKPMIARSYGRNPNIQIGVSEGEELVDEKKLKQLHWVYVCQREINGNTCNNCADSLGKAQAHWAKCYPDKELPFEQSVRKFRQGFFGKSKCNLCPRAYTTNHGYTIHTGHMHSDFRKKFNHCSNNDSIVCVTCRKQFNLPSEFQLHLDEYGECSSPMEYDAFDKNAKWVGNEMPGEKGQQEQNQTTPTKTPKSNNSNSSELPRRFPSGVNHSSNSRATRLANRRTMNHEEEVPEESFPPADCPVCGSTQEPKIVEHFRIAHSDMDLEVSRISESALRCQKCLISFAISDVVAHNIFCVGSKQFQYVKERKVAAAGSSGTRKSQPATPTGATNTNTGPSAASMRSFELPDDIGHSPIEVMEHDDLLAPELIKKAMRCGVCGRINKKLGVVSDCLRSHGVFRCALCFNTYKDRATYSNHLKTVHTLANGRLKCPLCDKNAFVNAGQVAGHLYGAHWLAVFQQVISAENQATAAAKLVPATPKLEITENEKIVAEVQENNSGDPIFTDGKEADYPNINLGSLLKSSESVFEDSEAETQPLVVPENKPEDSAPGPTPAPPEEKPGDANKTTVPPPVTVIKTEKAD